jgi:hypothetical protein
MNRDPVVHQDSGGSSSASTGPHAVLEAAILATRTHLIPPEEIRREYERLQIIVDKTAGPREQEAMSFLKSVVATRLGTVASTG